MMSVAALVGSFDDVVRSTAVLTEGIEGEFLKFVVHQEECRKKWHAAEKENVKLRQEFGKQKAEKDSLEVKLKHARNQVEIEINKRMKAEAAQDHLERQVALIRELLNDKETMSRLNDNERQTLIQLSQCHNPEDPSSPRKRPHIEESDGSILSPSDISYDNTEDDLDVPYLGSGKKVYKKIYPILPGCTDEGSPPKRTKTEKEDAERTRILSPDGPTVVTNYNPACTHAGKSYESPIGHTTAVPMTPVAVSRTPVSYTPSVPITPVHYTPKGPMYYGGSLSCSKKNAKGHAFCSKTVIKPESCQPCNKRIKFGKLALKCRDCRVVCHPDCKEHVPIPCVPCKNTPGSATTRPEDTLEFYAPTKAPMIPDVVVKCINEIEKRGLSEVGIYRVPGIDRQVKELKELFMQRKSPDLGKVDDIHVVCGTLKDFLRKLAEPLVTYGLWRMFVEAASKQDDDDSISAMYQAVSEMPQPNRDTLALLSVHLQKVSQCVECKMPISNLAKIFGPTIVGHSTPNIEHMYMLQEIKVQSKVVERLLSMPADYWNQFLVFDQYILSPPYNPATHNLNGTPVTPKTRPVPQSMLGPLSSSAATKSHSVKKKGSFLSRTPLTPRFGSKSRHPNKRPAYFFQSPKLK